MLWSLLGFASLAWAAPLAPPPPELFPRNGTVVARNAKVWVFGSNNTVQLFDPLGAEVAVSTVDVRGLFGEGVVQLVPRAALAPGAYQVSQFGTQLVTFTVTSDVDTVAPAAPQVTVSSTGKVGQLSAITTFTSGADAESFLVVMEEGQTWQTTAVLTTSLDGPATVVGLPKGETRLKVIRVDVAGNASEAADVVATVPADRACSVAPVLPLVLLASTLLRRRRVRT